MQLFVVVNRFDDVTDRQTTAMLVASLVRHGCPVLLAEVHAMTPPEASGAEPRVVPAIAIDAGPNCDAGQVQQRARTAATRPSAWPVAGDLVLIRTNPGRDRPRAPVHTAFLETCQRLMTNGVHVINDPTHLACFASKVSLERLDRALRPAMLVSDDPDRILQFIQASRGDSVLKPLVGSRGQDVVRVGPGQPDLSDRINRAVAGGPIVVQRFVTSAQPGDARIVVVGGKILEIGDRIAGIARHPGEGDFRGNLHAGGTAHPVVLSPGARVAVESAACLLNEHGIWLAGIDLVGDRIIEFNVFSTGGLYDASRFAGQDFADLVAERIIRKHHEFLA